MVEKPGEELDGLERLIFARVSRALFSHPAARPTRLAGTFLVCAFVCMIDQS